MAEWSKVLTTDQKSVGSNPIPIIESLKPTLLYRDMHVDLGTACKIKIP